MTNAALIENFQIGDIIWIAPNHHAFPVQLIARHDDTVWAAIELDDEALDNVIYVDEFVICDDEDDAHEAARNNALYADDIR